MYSSSKNTYLFASIALATLVVVSGPASARGFLAGIVEDVAPQLAPEAEALDRANGELGHPVEEATSEACDEVLPGCGVGLQTMWSVQRAAQDDDLGKLFTDDDDDDGQ